MATICFVNFPRLVNVHALAALYSTVPVSARVMLNEYGGTGACRMARACTSTWALLDHAGTDFENDMFF